MPIYYRHFGSLPSFHAIRSLHDDERYVIDAYQLHQTSAIGAKIKQYADHSAQLKVDGKALVSSFAGDLVNVAAVNFAAGQELCFAPNFQPGQGDFSTIQCALDWMAWPNNGNNKAPSGDHNVSVADGDKAYIAALNGKPYIARQSFEVDS